MNLKNSLFSLLCCLCQFAAFSQDSTTAATSVASKPRQHIYPSVGGDGPILSFGHVRDNGQHVATTPRFTLFFNIGRNYNYDVTKWLGFYSGINLKNIGIITKSNDSMDVKLKRRVYALGVPLGIKIGDVRGGDFFVFLGGQYDLALNYKEKQFVNGDKVRKFNEWFSHHTPLLMPSLFAGVRFYPGIGIKVQYYPNDFLNKEFKTGVYSHTESKLFFVTLTYDFRDPFLKNYHHFKRMRH
jgi:hypothetical protein